MAAVNKCVDAAVEAQFDQSVFYAEGFLQCRYQVEMLQKPLAELDGALTDEPSSDELLKAGCVNRLLGENFPYGVIFKEFMPKGCEGVSDNVKTPRDRL